MLYDFLVVIELSQERQIKKKMNEILNTGLILVFLGACGVLVNKRNILISVIKAILPKHRSS
jgi:hypothetical protein